MRASLIEFHQQGCRGGSGGSRESVKWDKVERSPVAATAAGCGLGTGLTQAGVRRSWFLPDEQDNEIGAFVPSVFGLTAMVRVFEQERGSSWWNRADRSAPAALC